MKKWILILGLLAVIGLSGTASAVSDGIITKEELKPMLDDPDLVILDVRTGRDWRSSEFKIQGAVRAKPSDFDTWSAQQSKDKRFVTYCA